MVAKARDRYQAYKAEESRGQAKKTEKIAEGKEGCVTVLSLKTGWWEAEGEAQLLWN